MYQHMHIYSVLVQQREILILSFSIDVKYWQSKVKFAVSKKRLLIDSSILIEC